MGLVNAAAQLPSTRSQGMELYAAVRKFQLLALVVCSLQWAPFLRTVAHPVDFYYFVLEWPGSYCDTWFTCCYPLSGKPATDFTIHGLWPNYDSGRWPSYCDGSNPFDPAKISDLIPELNVYWSSLACPSSNSESFWAHEWDKHGTCTESVLNQHAYFQAAISLRKKINLLGALESNGIYPDGSQYSLKAIEDALEQAVGFRPSIECNYDSSGTSQLYEVWVCVATDGSTLIKCPILPHSRCSSFIGFPPFGSSGLHLALS